MKSVTFKAMAGLTGGVLGWAIMEPSAPTNLADPAWNAWQIRFLLVVSALISLGVCAVSGWQKGSWAHVIRQSILGIVLGSIGGTLGVAVGDHLANGLMPGFNPELASTAIVAAIAWRTLALAPIGLFVGLGIGAAGLSVSRTIQGAIGGLFAGILSGLTFDIIGASLGHIILMSMGKNSGEVGGPSRAEFAALLGLGIGLFIGVAERIMRSAWVRLNLGRNEGKEWVIDRPQMSLGRAENADIPLRGDNLVAPTHAYIVKHGPAYMLADAGSQSGTFLNGQRISQAPLTHGDWIQIGGFALQFLMKAGAAPVRGPEMRQIAMPVGGYAPVGPGYPGMPQQQAPMQGNPFQGNPYQGIQNPSQQFPGSMPTQMQSGPVPSQSMPTQAISNPANPQASSSTYRFRLVTLDGAAAGQAFSVERAIEIGREVASGISVSQDPKASRVHARLSPGASGILVQDANSTNGTFINDQRVASQEARPGDILRIGSTNFRVESV